MVGGTAVAVGLAILSERARSGAGGLRPAMEGAVSASAGGFADRVSAVRAQVEAKGIGHATVLGATVASLAGVIALSMYGIVALAGVAGPSSASAAEREPVKAAGVMAAAGGGWEEAYAAAVPDAAARGVALLGETTRQHQIDTLIALYEWGEQQKAAQSAQTGRVAGSAVAPVPGKPTTYATTSGYGPGTVLSARVTIYGCVGSGGGFCGGMASGYTVFEGAAACSSDMKFGTQVHNRGRSDGPGV